MTSSHLFIKILPGGDLPGIERSLSGQEALALQGFGHAIQRVTDEDRPYTQKELMDLAGNAFNGGVCSAVFLTMARSLHWADMHKVQATSIAAAVALESIADDDADLMSPSASGEEGGESEDAQECTESEDVEVASDEGS